MLAREVEGVPDRVIAERFELSVTAVRVRMHRARRKIRSDSRRKCHEPKRLQRPTRDESHVFTCPACRVDARIAGAWKGLRDRGDCPCRPTSVFIRRVVARSRADAGPRARLRWVAAAAAAALFSFFAGLAHEHASQPSPTPEDVASRDAHDAERAGRAGSPIDERSAKRHRPSSRGPQARGIPFLSRAGTPKGSLAALGMTAAGRARSAIARHPEGRRPEGPLSQPHRDSRGIPRFAG